MSLLSRGRTVYVCLRCGGRLARKHRTSADIKLKGQAAVRRFQCVSPTCDWEGTFLVDVPTRMQGGMGSAWPGWRSRALLGVVGIVLTVAAVQAARVYLKHAHERDQQYARIIAASKLAAAAPLPPPLAIGESYDGEVLAEDDVRKVANHSPLTLRRGCAWGVPGRDPYKGTVAQALIAAKVPESAVRKFEAMIEMKLVSDEVEITRDGITSVSKRRRFDGNSFDMAFGSTMCFSTNVNFARGHVEKAKLYEATDADGKLHAVMVPDVCGNVTVLGDTINRNDRDVPNNRDVLNERFDRNEANGGNTRNSGSANNAGATGTGTGGGSSGGTTLKTSHSVPEPESMILFAGGLALLVGVSHIRKRRHSDRGT